MPRSTAAADLADAGSAPDTAALLIGELFERSGARGFLWARQVGSDSTIEMGADEPVAVASVIKILIALAFARAVHEGSVDATQQVTIPAELQVGGTGTTGCLDPVALSLRDAALFMMSVSDNAATDVVLAEVGARAVEGIIDELGLAGTVLRADMTAGARQVVSALGLPDAHDLDASIRRAPDSAVRELAWIDPARANASTPREIGELLDAIWTDRAGPPAACALVRSLMSHQVTEHRIASGFPGDEVVVASKTGTLPSIRNDAGVVTLPDGRAFVVAVFTRSESLTDHQPAIDAAIGRAAAIAVDHLSRLDRGGEGRGGSARRTGEDRS